MIATVVLFVLTLSGCGSSIGKEFVTCLASDCVDAELELALDAFTLELEMKNELSISLNGYEQDLVISRTKTGATILLHYVRSDLNYEDGFNEVENLFAIHDMIEEGLNDLDVDEEFSLISRVYITEGTSLHHFTFEDVDNTSEKKMNISLEQTDEGYTTFLSKVFFEYKDMLDYRIHDYEVQMQVDTELGEIVVILPNDSTEISIRYESYGGATLYSNQLNDILLLLADALNDDYTIVFE